MFGEESVKRRASVIPVRLGGCLRVVAEAIQKVELGKLEKLLLSV